MSKLPEVPTEDLLKFHEYPASQTIAGSTDSSSYGENKEKSSENNSSFNITIDDAKEDPVASTASFWTLEYYQQFFDVDTKDVVDRIIASMLPKRSNFIKNEIKRKPDMYGPFWITITLIFTIAISGNVANYLQHANMHYHWKYNFHLVSYASTAIFIYVMFVPIALWATLKWSTNQNDLDGLEESCLPNLLELVCVYGYSLFIYIPVSILWTIQVNWLQWLLVIVAACISGSVLLLTLMPALKLSKHKLVLILGIISCHTLLAAGFMLYFFHVPPSAIILNTEENHTNNTHLTGNVLPNSMH